MTQHYALILEDPPAARAAEPSKTITRAAALDRARQREMAQRTVAAEAVRRGFRLVGSVQLLGNIVFVESRDQNASASLATLPGVSRVERMAKVRPLMNRAVDLTGVRQAWNLVGGTGKAGEGMKIAVVDTGIDQTHPALQDPSLLRPPGFPKCSGDECNYTNSKVIAARSYVSQLALSGFPSESRPDDLSPRDRVGHGTAVAMIAAGKEVDGHTATITGVAPRAYLGNYKVFGSPGVNDYTFASVPLDAMEDAIVDGMDIIVLALGAPAVVDPLSSTCGIGGTQPCDLWTDAVQSAVALGVVVVAAAGNSGDYGSKFPSYNSIETPGVAPDAITVGATTNSHLLFASVYIPGDDVPQNLRAMNALFGDGPRPGGPFSAPLADVTRLGDDGLACESLGTGTLTGRIALVKRGTCAFSIKVNNAQAAGAVAVIIYQWDGVNSIFPPTGLATTGIPAAMIANSNGVALKDFLATHLDRTATLDPTLVEVEVSDFNDVDYYSSRGPAIGTYGIKPELVATGSDLYTATQNFDFNGDLFDTSRFTSVGGTSFAAALTAGAAAVVWQRNPGFTPAQVKSALVNTADPNVGEWLNSTTRVTAEQKSAGAGLLRLDKAVETTVTASPATVSFGDVRTVALPVSRRVTFKNTGNQPVSLTITDSRGIFLGAPTALNLNPGQSGDVTLEISNRPATGNYEGVLEVKGGTADLRVPYYFAVGDGVADNIFPVLGLGFVGVVSEPLPFGGLVGFKLVDRYGVPVAEAPVNFTPAPGGGWVPNPNVPGAVLVDPETDVLGIAAARPILGPQLGEQMISAQAAGLRVEFYGYARLRPTINTNGVVNGASFQVGPGLAAGSFISIFGVGLSDASFGTPTLSLPLSLAGVSVSFDKGSLSLPGRLHYVSPGQINLQIPWEFEGLNDVQMKISIGDISSALYSVPLASASPAAFEINDPTSARLIAAALDVNYALITDQNPARRGQVIQVFCNGLGRVNRRPATGEPSPGDPAPETLEKPTATIGGRPATVHFSGLSPGSVALYQVNVEVPADAPTGRQPIEFTIGGVTSKTAYIPVQ